VQDGSHTANRTFETTKPSVAFQTAPKHMFLESFQTYTEIFRDKIRNVRALLLEISKSADVKF